MPPEAGGVATDSPTVKILLYSENPNDYHGGRWLKFSKIRSAIDLGHMTTFCFFSWYFVLVFSPVTAEVSDLFPPAQKIPPPAKQEDPCPWSLTCQGLCTLKENLGYPCAQKPTPTRLPC